MAAISELIRTEGNGTLSFYMNLYRVQLSPILQRMRILSALR